MRSRRARSWLRASGFGGVRRLRRPHIRRGSWTSRELQRPPSYQLILRSIGLKAFTRKTVGGLLWLVKSRLRLTFAALAVMIVGAGSAVSLAQSGGGASANPFG